MAFSRTKALHNQPWRVRSFDLGTHRLDKIYIRVASQNEISLRQTHAQSEMREMCLQVGSVAPSMQPTPSTYLRPSAWLIRQRESTLITLSGASRQGRTPYKSAGTALAAASSRGPYNGSLQGTAKCARKCWICSSLLVLLYLQVVVGALLACAICVHGFPADSPASSGFGIGSSSFEQNKPSGSFG